MILGAYGGDFNLLRVGSSQFKEIEIVHKSSAISVSALCDRYLIIYQFSLQSGWDHAIAVKLWDSLMLAGDW